MKKFVVLLVVVAMTFISAIAYAEVTVGGEFAVRSRNFDNMDRSDANPDAAGHNQRDTQSRVKIDVNAKVGDVKGKIQLWNDFESWNGLEKNDGNTAGCVDVNADGACNPGEPATLPASSTLGFREAWVSFNLPGLPVNVTAGHQLLTVGNGWFFRSGHFGSDAWVIANTTGNNTLAFVNVKVAEGVVQNADDVDAYVLLDVFKLNDNMTIGADLSMVKFGRGQAGDDNLQNIGVNFNGKLGPVALKAAVDLQMGEDETGPVDSKYKGNQVVVQGSVPVDPVTINFTVARGSGETGGADTKRFISILDVDPHYTFLWEYKLGPGANATSSGAKNFGFSNTTALGIGATFAATKSLSVGADFWHLMATEDVNNSDTYGQEIDVKVNWKVAENLSWNWVLGMFMPDDASGAGQDDATGIQGILAFKF